MTKEEIKQWLRNQIDSSLKIQDKYNKNIFYLRYNKSYIRALKFSKITGQPVNKDDFKGGDILFSFNTKAKTFYHYSEIGNYIEEHYSNDYIGQIKIVEEVINEYSEYKGYKTTYSKFYN